jgi:hypothetical protein
MKEKRNRTLVRAKSNSGALRRRKDKEGIVPPRRRSRATAAPVKMCKRRTKAYRNSAVDIAMFSAHDDATIPLLASP